MSDDAPAAPPADPGEPRPRKVRVRVSRLTLAALFAGGLFLGALGAGLAAVRTQVRGAWVPWGLVLVLLGILVCTRGAAWLVGSRSGGAAVAVGWLLPTLVLATTGPGGDVLLPDVLRTQVYLIGGAALAALAAAVPLPRGTAELVASLEARPLVAPGPDPGDTPAAPD